MLQRWQAVGKTVSNLTGARFESQTFRSKAKGVTARPTGQYTFDLKLKVNLLSIRFSSAFVRFCTFFLLHEIVCSFSSAFCMSISALSRQSYWTKVFRKDFSCEGGQLYFKILLSSFMHKIFVQTFIKM